MENETLNNNPTIDEFCKQWNIDIPAIDTIKIGQYAIGDPSVKDAGEAINKIWYKLAENGLEDGYHHGWENQYINGHEGESFNTIRDWARATVFVPDYASAIKVVETIAQNLQGQVSYHDAPDYKAIHIYVNMNGINTEIQVHTPKTRDLKELTHGHYKKWRDLMVDQPSIKKNPVYLHEQAIISAMCKHIYDESGFDQVKPQIKQLATTFHKAPTPMQETNIVSILKKAHGAQDELITELKTILNTLTMMEKERDSGKTL